MNDVGFSGYEYPPHTRLVWIFVEVCSLVETNSLSVIVWLSHVSVPMRMSGSDSEMKLPSSAVLLFILWKFILMILKGL